jgi:hypothetical protein
MPASVIDKGKALDAGALESVNLKEKCRPGILRVVLVRSNAGRTFGENVSPC